jgi:long-chain acyl-CoA synthetase
MRTATGETAHPAKGQRKEMADRAKPRTIPDLVEAGLAKNPTGLACATKRDGAWIETAVDEFRSKVRQFALGLYDLGVRPGDRVALHTESSAEWLIVDQGVLRLGAVTVPIYTTQPGDQIRHILEDSGARVYVVSTQRLFASVKPYLDDISTLDATVGILGTYHSSMCGFDEVLARGRQRSAATPGLLETLTAAVTPDDLAAIVYTSGTTGQPKGVMLTHGNLAFDTLATLAKSSFDVEAHLGAVMLSYLPLSHAFERIMALLYLHIGYPIYFIEDVGKIRDDLQTVRPIHFSTVPRLLEKIHAGIEANARTLSGLQKQLMQWALGLAERYDVEMTMSGLDRLRYGLAERLVFRKLRNFFGGNLLSMTCGGAPLSPVTMNFFNALGVFCGQGYGMTESSPVITTTMPGEVRTGSVGKPLPGVEIAIADDGEILTRGPHVMKGYYRLPEETARVMAADGWLRTGDIGRIDEEGFLFVTDRKKELFKLSTGKYVAPAPIETALGSSSLIEYVVVVGNACKYCSALLVPDVEAIRHQLDGQVASSSTADMCTHASVVALIQREVDVVNARLPHWEKIKKFRMLSGSFSVEGGELTPTLKVKRRVVCEKYMHEIAAMYG